MIANNFDEFVEKVFEAERNSLNTTEKGRDLTNSLLKSALEANLNMTPEEWEDIKSKFMTYLFLTMLKNHDDMMEEFSNHVFNRIMDEPDND